MSKQKKTCAKCGFKRTRYTVVKGESKTHYCHHCKPQPVNR